MGASEMPLRATGAEVREIIETDLDDDQVLPFLDTSNVLVDEHLIVTPAISAPLLKKIEIYLAAHFITLWDPRSQKEEAGDTRFTYEGKTAMGLDSSKYGQMAQTLDPTGKLSQLDNDDRQNFIFRIGNETDVETIP